MKTIAWNVRASKSDWQLIKSAAAESHMSLNRFTVGSAKLLAVLSLHEEDRELVIAKFADLFGSMIDRLGDELDKRRKRA